MTTANGRVPEDPDNFLFHYTDGHGLLGILKDKAIWATDAMFLNDRNELLHFAPDLLDALLARIQELRASAQEKAGVSIETIDTPTLESAQFQLASSAQRTIERFKESPLESRFHVHVACFCEGGDILSQWRGYASNKGYAIAVKPQSLQSMVVNPGPSGMGGVYDGFSPVVRLDMVRYGSAEARADIASLLNRLVPPDFISDRGVPSLRGQWNGIETLALVKHPAFKEER